MYYDYYMGRGSGGSKTINKTVSRRNKENTSSLLPVSKKEYYQDLHAKHFDENSSVGSRFTEADSIEAVLEIASNEAGGIGRDDREKFIDAGVPEDALLPQCRYLMVKTPGTVGIRQIKDCWDDDMVFVKRTKEGAPCSLVVETAPGDLGSSDVSTLILGPNPDDENKEIVWTAHPGLPIRPAMEDIWEEGSHLHISVIEEQLGSDAWIQLEPQELLAN